MDYNKNEIDKKDFNEKLLRIFINIFYYENYLSESKERAFDNNEKYYLINPKWLKMYKNYYNYDDLLKFLKTNKRNNSICYNNLEDKYKNIIDEVVDKKIINFEKKELSEDLLGIKQINCFVIRQYNIFFVKEGIIFPSKIMQLILQIHECLPNNIFPKELYFMSNNIIYIIKSNKNIIIGNLNEKNIFIPKYVFIFKSIENLENEKNKIWTNSFSIKKYKQKSKPIDNNINFRIFKNEENEEIYKLVILLNKDKKRAKTPNIEETNNKKRPFSKNYLDNINNFPRHSFNIGQNKIQNEVNSTQNSFITYENNSNKVKEQEKEEGDFIINKHCLGKGILINKTEEMKNKINELTQNESILKKELENKNKELKEYENKYNNLNKNYLELKGELEKSNIEIKKYENIKEQIENKEKQLIKRESEILKKEENYNKKLIILKEKENNLIYIENKAKNENLDFIKNLEIVDKLNENELKIWNYEDIQNIMISIIEKIKIKNIEQKKVIEQLKEIILKDPLFFYSSPVLIGLKKIGQLNYMNAVIQCLSQTKNLTYFF